LWSGDGRRLLVLQAFALRVYDGSGHVTARDDPSDATEDVDAAFVPATRRALVIRKHGAQSTLFRLDTGASVFSGTGDFSEVTSSPEGRFVLLGWPTADQWVFVRIVGAGRRIRGVANVSSQFRSAGFPRVDGWTSGE
jgi:hypothetical protein